MKNYNFFYKHILRYMIKNKFVLRFYYDRVLENIDIKNLKKMLMSNPDILKYDKKEYNMIFKNWYMKQFVDKLPPQINKDIFLTRYKEPSTFFKIYNKIIDDKECCAICLKSVNDNYKWYIVLCDCFGDFQNTLYFQGKTIKNKNDLIYHLECIKDEYRLFNFNISYTCNRIICPLCGHYKSGISIMPWSF
jgi:hypothetical protein